MGRGGGGGRSVRRDRITSYRRADQLNILSTLQLPAPEPRRPPVSSEPADPPDVSSLLPRSIRAPFRAGERAAPSATTMAHHSNPAPAQVLVYIIFSPALHQSPIAPSIKRAARTTPGRVPRKPRRGHDGIPPTRGAQMAHKRTPQALRGGGASADNVRNPRKADTRPTRRALCALSGPPPAASAALSRWRRRV